MVGVLRCSLNGSTVFFTVVSIVSVGCVRGVCVCVLLGLVWEMGAIEIPFIIINFIIERNAFRIWRYCLSLSTSKLTIMT